jgi:hypothetical protein
LETEIGKKTRQLAGFLCLKIEIEVVLEVDPSPSVPQKLEGRGRHCAWDQAYDRSGGTGMRATGFGRLDFSVPLLIRLGDVKLWNSS